MAEYRRVQSADPGGTAFQTALFNEYRALADVEKAQGDWLEAGDFASKALAASRGETVVPFDPEERTAPPFALPEMKNGYERLLIALDEGARSAQPEEAARAQTRYDCWLLERKQHIRPNRIEACRVEFWAALARLEAAAARRASQPPVTAAPQQPAETAWSVRFAFGSAALDEPAKQAVAAAAAAAGPGPGTLKVTGFTDAAGPAEVNRMLAARRAEAVAAELRRHGLEGDRITVAAVGEAKSGAERDPQSRRVDIELVN